MRGEWVVRFSFLDAPSRNNLGELPCLQYHDPKLLEFHTWYLEIVNHRK